MAKDSSKPVFIRMTIVSARKDEKLDAYLTRAEGPMGARMSWFSDAQPRYKVGDQFTVKFDWKK